MLGRRHPGAGHNGCSLLRTALTENAVPGYTVCVYPSGHVPLAPSGVRPGGCG